MSGERAQPLATSRYTGSLIWAVVVCLGVALVLTPPAQAQSGIQVVANPAPEYAFGKALTFRLSVTSSAQLSRITLFCQPQAGGGQAWSAPAAFTPGQSVTAVYTRDLTTFSQAPFVNLEYWWQVDDQAGQHLTTPHQNLFYGDNRFGWQTTSQTPLTVHWYQGDAAFGQTALGIASAGLALANGDLQAPLPAQINIYVYATAADAQAALSPAGRIWVEARSDPPLNLIVAVASPGMGAEQILGRQLPHELTHLLIYRLTGDHYADVPTWLNEGLAETKQARPDPALAGILGTARASNTLLPLASLCQPFPADPAQAQLAYAQSESVVRYMERRYSPGAISGLLAAYAAGNTCEGGVQNALGLSLAQLEHDWLSDLSGADAAASQASLWPWLGLSAVVLLAGAVLGLLVGSGPKPLRP